MKHKRKHSPLKMADGGALPISPFSLRGIGQSMGSAYNGMRGGLADTMETVHNRLTPPPGYVPVSAAPVATAPAQPAPLPGQPQLQLGGMNMDVNARREAAAGLADGGVLPPKPSPFSLRGMGQALGGAYDGLRGGMADAMETAHARVSPPPGYVSAVAAPPAPVTVQAQPQPQLQLGGVNMGALQRREAAAGLRDGGMVHGKGGPVDDKVPAKLSPGESVLPADTTAAIGPHNVQAMIDETHTPAHLQRQGVPPGGRQGLRHFANGVAGLDVTESPFTESDARMFGRTPAGTVPGAQPQVPGMEVSESPMARAQERGFIRDPGPGNPNVGQPRPVAAAAPAAAEAATAAEAAAAGAAGGTAGAGGMAYRAGRMAASGLRMAAPAVIAGNVATSLGDHKISDDLAPVDSSAMGTLRYLSHGDWNNAGESLKKGAVEAGMDLATGLAKTGDMFRHGTPFQDGLRNQFQADLGTGVQTRTPAAPAAVPQGAAAAANPTDARLQAGAQDPPMNGGTSGVPNAGGVQKSVDASGRVTYTNVDGGQDFGGFTGQPSAQNAGAAQALSDRYGAAARAGLRGGMEEANLPAGYGTTIPGLNAPASQAEQELNARNAGVHSTFDDRGLSSNQRALQVAAREANAVHLATARMNNDTARQVNERNAGVSLRGQDIGATTAMRGQDMTSATARNAARIEQMNKDRTFQFDVQKHGDEVAKSRFEMRQSAEKNVHEQIANMLPPGVDGKPDTATAARYAAGLNALVSQQQSVLQQRAQQGDQHAAAALDDLSKNGLGALDPKMIRDHIQGMKAKDLSDQYASGRFNPVGGTGTITDVPAAGLRKTGDGFLGFGGEYSLVGPDGRPTGATIPSRAVEGDGSFFGGQRRTDLRNFVR